ncbi:MAG: hypothetical protein QG622_832 [Actinomycetota bacterium]|nr:hypothetical protein [Actinomycetota bacterium]
MKERFQVELRQLRNFLVFADEMSFLRASQRLGVAQPNLTVLVQRLEKEIGADLVDRSTRPVQLTPVGMRFLEEARLVVAAADRAVTVARTESRKPLSVFRLGTVPAMGDRLEVVLESLAHRRPEMRVELEGLPTAERLEQVRSGRLDAAFVRFHGDAPGLVLVPAWREPLLAALPLGSPPGQWPGVRLDRLTGLPLLLVARERNPGLHDLVQRRCRGADPRIAPGQAVAGLRGALEAVAQGAGWTVVPESLVAEGRPDGVACLPFDPAITLPVHFAVRARDEYTYLLLEACREVMAAVPGSAPVTASSAVLAPALT